MTADEIYEQDREEARWERLWPTAAPDLADDITLGEGVLPPAPTATLRGILPGGGAWIHLGDR